MLCGVLRHAERADAADFGTVDGEFWYGSVDQQVWPFDPPLSDEGVAHAHRLAATICDFAELQGSHFDVVVTSPYKRCVQTALIVTAALGCSTKVLVDRSLGEVFSGECLGTDKKPRSVVRPVEGWQAAWSGEVDCVCQAIGTWPEWEETVDQARLRYAHCFLSYLKRGADAWSNFLLVTHGNGVAAALSMLPFARGKGISSVKYGGMFLAKAQDLYDMPRSLYSSEAEARDESSSPMSRSSLSSLGSPETKALDKQPGSNRDSRLRKSSSSPARIELRKDSSPFCGTPSTPPSLACPEREQYKWEAVTYNIKLSSASGSASTRLLKTVSETIADSSSMTMVDMEALLTAGMRACMLQDNYENDDDDDEESNDDSLLDGPERSRQMTEGTEVFSRLPSKQREALTRTRNGSKSSYTSNDSAANYSTAVQTPPSARRQTSCQRNSSGFEIDVASIKLLQSTWDCQRSIVLCDGRIEGCPIYHASDGFLQLFEFTTADVVGKPCGQIVRPDLLLDVLTWQSRWHVSGLMRNMLKSIAHADRTGSAVLLNRKKSGTLFVNLLVMRTHQSQMTRVPYIIGVQQDVTHDISIPMFLRCCQSEEHYAALVSTQEKALAERVAHLDLDCDHIFREIFDTTQSALETCL